MKKYKLVIIGTGALGSIIGKAVSQDLSENYKILGVLSGKLENAIKLADEIGCKAYKTLDDILSDKPDYVIEAASPEVFKDIGVKILANGIHLIPLSIGAFADQEFYDTVKETALQNNSCVHIPSGAVGGFDVLRSAMLMGEVKVSMTTEKSPQSLNGAPFLKGRELSEDQSEAIFSGSAKEAIEHFPKNVNVAVATALATTGVENTKIAIHSIAGSKSNKHTIKLEGETIKIEVIIETTPSQDNPKSSALAAYSVIGLLKNLVAPIVF
ncbi:aspartate dehydrogenase domain-containing protein [Gelidibacter sp.]|uniref:aspartate dehydrogenase domain-containing protein n=1 Tax=Gelidibacter sp. TaxID=2018083 RepID=UPI002C22C6B0|nr:aspartate dehydrogenase domain-containing protein [Gelidibacter sp.]HUH29272.1 aspartate dehydrogenase domain-containing protein [Gelidibacter sp.]